MSSTDASTSEGMRSTDATTDEGTRSTDPTTDEGTRSTDPTTNEGTRSTDATAGEGMRSSEAATTARGSTGTTETETGDYVGSAAERLGGPSEGERTAETARRADSDVRDEADTAAQERATLIAPERAESYNSRWNELKGQFVDEPRAAVRGANELVGEVLDELEELFRRQRADLEHGLDSEQTSTEDLRLALGRYRSFFDRLLSF
jgi:hypothetical protein